MFINDDTYWITSETEAISQLSTERESKGFWGLCLKPAWERNLQCSSHGWKQKQLVGEPTAEWVSYECSSNKHGPWILCCQSTSSHDPSLCQLAQMRRTCGVTLCSFFFIYRIGHGTDMSMVSKMSFMCVPVARFLTALAWFDGGRRTIPFTLS